MPEPPKRVLIVDDDAEVRDTISTYVAKLGHTVETASNGPDALAAILRSRPDVVLLDVRMPGMDGVEVLQRIRGIDSTIPVIMVTGTPEPAVIGKTLADGAFAYIPKPFDLKYLDHLIATC